MGSYVASGDAMRIEGEVLVRAEGDFCAFNS